MGLCTSFSVESGVAEAGLLSVSAAAGWCDLFDSVQLIPASSGFDHHSAQKDTAHFPAIKKELGISYSDMLFFDDESPNISKVM